MKTKNTNTNMQIYVPVLLKFHNDKVVLSETLLSDIKMKIRAVKEVKSYDEYEVRGFNFLLDTKTLLNGLSLEDQNDFIVTIKLYYYHHRFIFFYDIDYDNKKFKTRDIRAKINDNYKMFMDLFISNMNDCILKSNEINNNDALVTLYYSYPIVLSPYNENNFKRITSRLETLFFTIYLPNKIPLSYGDKTYIRISIPSFTLYHRRKLNDYIVANIINAVYQICLYEKKLEDYNESNLITDYSRVTNDKYNQLNEPLLKDMWEYSVDSMAGRISDQHQQNISRVLYAVSILSFVLSIGAIIISLLK